MDDLYLQLERLMESIDEQIYEVGELALELGCRTTQVKTVSGEFMITPLLITKAQVLNAMVTLQTS